MPPPTFALVHGAHWHVAAPFELQDGREFQSREVFQHDQDGLFIHPIFNVGITFRTRDHDQAVGFDLLPEGLVIHRLQPIHNIIDVSEFTHGFSISERIRLEQISPLPSLNQKDTSHV